MVAIKDKGQKLYTCAHVWQELYKKAARRTMEKRPRKPEKEAETQPSKKMKTPAKNPAASSQEGSGVSNIQRGALGLLQQFLKGAANQAGQKKEGVQASLKALLGSLIPAPGTSTQEHQTPKRKHVQEPVG